MAIRCLQLLADGKVHSGDEIGACLGISRTAVWKQLKKLEGLGIEVVAIKGQGYQLPRPLDLLDHSLIGSKLSPAVLDLGIELDCKLSTGSTSADALMWAKQHQRGGYVCIAEHQTDGRGRRGKVWQSPFGANLYGSLVWQFDAGVAAVEGLSLAVGVCLVDALQDLGLSDAVMLKWPNDVLVGGKKLSGILLEMEGDPAGICHVVVGVGINVDMPSSSAEAIDQPWTDLSRLTGDFVSRNDLAGVLLNRLVPLLVGYEASGFEPYRQRWCELDAYRDTPIKLLLGAKVIEGIGRGVDRTGALLLERPDGQLETYSGGEISLRAAQ